MKEDLQSEVRILKEQVQILQNVVTSLQRDTKTKESSLIKLTKDKEKFRKEKVKISKEKEKLNEELRIEKRSSTDLKKLLDNERKSYFEIKESYIHKINEASELKEKLLTEKKSSNFLNSENVKVEVRRLRNALRETLEANYNLSIKFLRMKSTKSLLKNKLTKIQEDQTKIAVELESRISLLNKELSLIISNKNTQNSPKYKRYLQVIQQNASLLHENFCLHMEIERLTEQLNEMQEVLIKYKLNNKFKYYQTKSSTNEKIDGEKLKENINSQQVNENSKSLTKINEKINEKKEESVRENEISNSEERQNNIEMKNKSKEEEKVQNHPPIKEDLLNLSKSPSIAEKISQYEKLTNNVKKTSIKSPVLTIENRMTKNRKISIITSNNNKDRGDFLNVNKTCDSDGLDLVQISDFQMTNSSKPNNPINQNFFYVSARSFCTQSCPNILPK